MHGCIDACNSAPALSWTNSRTHSFPWLLADSETDTTKVVYLDICQGSTDTGGGISNTSSTSFPFGSGFKGNFLQSFELQPAKPTRAEPSPRHRCVPIM
jgi:hypothetical protein